MRVLLLVVWALLPLGLLVFHYGPGQKQLAMDEASALLRQADRFVADGSYDAAQVAFEQALAALPADQTAVQYQARLELYKSQMLNKQLPEANVALSALLQDIQNDANKDESLYADVRSAYASSQYYMTWLLRLEGQPREVWEPEIDVAQQYFRQLATEAETVGDEERLAGWQQDLEAAVRMARMDLGELQAVPLPRQCQGCNCSGGKRPGKKPGKGKKPGEQPPEQEKSRAAGMSPPADGEGS